MHWTIKGIAPWFERSIAGLAGQHAEDLARAGMAAMAGGRTVAALYGADTPAESGAWGGPVTEADRASHRAIVDVLAPCSPVDWIISEEGNTEDLPSGVPPRGARLWLVDPLDGTREFLARNGEFSVMVGLAVDGGAVLGAVYLPVPDRLFLGIVDGGAWVIDRVHELVKVRELRIGRRFCEGQAVRIVQSRSHADERVELLADVGPNVEWVVSGSVGIKCALIAEERADLYVHPVPYLKEWDTCAPEAVLSGAGGRVTGCHGDHLRYGKLDPHQPTGIFAASGGIWNQVASRVRRIFDDTTKTGSAN